MKGKNEKVEEKVLNSWDIPEKLKKTLSELEKGLQETQQRHQQAVSNLIEGFISDKIEDENPKIKIDWEKNKIVQIE